MTAQKDSVLSPLITTIAMTTKIYRVLLCAARHCASHWREGKERDGGERERRRRRRKIGVGLLVSETERHTIRFFI